MKPEERHKHLAAQLKECAQALLDGKLIVGVISNKEKFEKLKSNPKYDKIYLKHLQYGKDAEGFSFDLVIKIQNPGMIDEGASEAVRKKGKMIYNQYALFELYKELRNANN